MNLLAITQHTPLLERLRTAFEGAGHRVDAVADQLQTLASEAWNQAHLILVEASGDPMDGYRLCDLLRGESRALFRNLPIFIILDHAPDDDDRARLLAVDGDGFIERDSSLPRLLKVIGPLLEGNVAPNGRSQIQLLGCGLPRADAQVIGELVQHYGFSLRCCAPGQLFSVLAEAKPAILFLGLEDGGEEALEILRGLPDLPQAPYPVLVGPLLAETQQRKLLTAGAMDWLTLPLSAPMLIHVARRAMEWRHAKRIQHECQVQLSDLAGRRALLEMEASALRNEVLTDPLTELLNRRAFDQNLEHAIHQWERHRRSFVLIIGDLDYFKLINDRFGHLVGDLVLKNVAQRIHASLRRSDLAFRIGGEEFAVLLSETTLAAGLEVAEKIRRRIDESPLTLESGQGVFPTMSFGIGGPDREDLSTLFERVDQALYMAKHKGRNRVEVMGNHGV